MSNKNKNFTVPTQEIKLLLKIRGQSQLGIARSAGVSNVVLNKFLNKVKSRNGHGNGYYYKVPHIQQAIAKYLDIPQETLWSSAGSATLRKLIADEMVAKKRIPKNTSPKKKMQPWNIITFFKNIIALGK